MGPEPHQVPGLPVLIFTKFAIIAMYFLVLVNMFGRLCDRRKIQLNVSDNTVTKRLRYENLSLVNASLSGESFGDVDYFILGGHVWLYIEEMRRMYICLVQRSSERHKVRGALKYVKKQ